MTQLTKNRLIALLVIGTLSTLANLGFPQEKPVPVKMETYIVEQEDTLWEIARERYPKVNTGEMVYEIREINGLDSAIIRPGQRLRLPVDI